MANEVATCNSIPIAEKKTYDCERAVPPFATNYHKILWALKLWHKSLSPIKLTKMWFIGPLQISNSMPYRTCCCITIQSPLPMLPQRLRHAIANRLSTMYLLGHCLFIIAILIKPSELCTIFPLVKRTEMSQLGSSHPTRYTGRRSGFGVPPLTTH